MYIHLLFQEKSGTGAYVYHFNITGHVVNSTFQSLKMNTQAQQDAKIAKLVEVMNGRYKFKSPG